MQTVTIKGTEYTVEANTAGGMVAYFLKGPRGGVMAAIRNAKRPSVLFVMRHGGTDARIYGRLVESNGTLTVVQ